MSRLYCLVHTICLDRDLEFLARIDLVRVIEDVAVCSQMFQKNLRFGRHQSRISLVA